MTARNFENARKIAREAVFAHARLNGRGGDIDDSDRAIGIKWMSNLLWEVPSWEGGLIGLSDAAFDAFCEQNSQYVSREIALKAQWAHDVTWPPDAEEEAELARWREVYARNLAWRAAHPEPADPEPAAVAPECIAHTARPRSPRLKSRDPAAARALAANIDRVLGVGLKREEAA